MNKIREIEKLNEQELEAGVSIKGSWHNDYNDTAYIYIGGLPYNLTEGDILAIFSQYGNPVHLNLVRDKETGKSKGFAFLKYEDQRSTVLAVDNFNGTQILGRPIRVDHTRYEAKDDEEVKPVSEIEREEEEEKEGEKETRSEKEESSDDRRRRDRSKDRERCRRERSRDRRHHHSKDRGRRRRSKDREQRDRSKDREQRDRSKDKDQRDRSKDRRRRDRSKDRERRHHRERKRERPEDSHRNHRHRNEDEPSKHQQEEDDPELMDPMKDYLHSKKRKS
jgi:RNA-binding motif X-linked protein 2